MTYGKNKRYRQKQMEQGKCPHCGKDCEPGFKQCRKRIIDKAMNRVVRQLMDKGISSTEFINLSFDKGDYTDYWYDKLYPLFQYMDYDSEKVTESIEVRIFITKMK